MGPSWWAAASWQQWPRGLASEFKEFWKKKGAEVIGRMALGEMKEFWQDGIGRENLEGWSGGLAATMSGKLGTWIAFFFANVWIMSTIREDV